MSFYHGCLEGVDIKIDLFMEVDIFAEYTDIAVDSSKEIMICGITQYFSLVLVICVRKKISRNSVYSCYRAF